MTTHLSKLSHIMFNKKDINKRKSLLSLGEKFGGWGTRSLRRLASKVRSGAELID